MTASRYSGSGGGEPPGKGGNALVVAAGDVAGNAVMGVEAQDDRAWRVVGGEGTEVLGLGRRQAMGAAGPGGDDGNVRIRQHRAQAVVAGGLGGLVEQNVYAHGQGAGVYDGLQLFG